MKTAYLITKRRHFDIFDRKSIGPMRGPPNKRLLINLLESTEDQPQTPFYIHPLTPQNPMKMAEPLST